MNPILHRVHFLSRFLSAPRSIGSITPSSRFLVDSMLKPIPWTEIQTIVELGAGTGVVTREIERRKQENSVNILFETDAFLCEQLRKENPNRIICSDAKKLRAELTKLNIPKVDCIVSSLPFANFSLEDRMSILQEIKGSLLPDQLFIAYQYSLQMKPYLRQIFQQVDVHFVPFNLPPAFVYICR